MVVFVGDDDGADLWVDGLHYGKLKKGDVVDFYSYPEIQVNGVRRKPTSA